MNTQTYYFRRAIKSNDVKSTNDINDLIEMLPSTVPVVEVIKKGVWIRPYFDLDYQVLKYDKDEVDDLYEKTKAFICSEFGVSEDDMTITKGCFDTHKYASYHIILNGIKTKKEDMRAWVEKNQKYIKDELKNGIDKAVYACGEKDCAGFRNHLSPKTKGGDAGSLLQGSKEDTLIQNVEDSFKVFSLEKQAEKKKILSEVISYVDADEIRQLFNECFDKTHLEDYNNWLIFTFAFHSIDAYELWDELCKQCGGYDEDKNLKIWTNIKSKDTDGVSIGTFYYLCRQMNPEKYEAIKGNKSDAFESFTNYSVAKKFYELFKDKYLYSSKLGWYEINDNNVWTQSLEKYPTSLIRNITESISKILKDDVKAILKKKEKTEQDEKKIKEFSKRIDTIGGSRFCSNCIDFLTDMFKVDKIEDLMDENRYLFAFNDKVVDMKTMEVRDIKPTDYISITTGYNYPKRNNKVINDILAFITTIFENKDNEMYLLKTLASCLLGVKRFEEFYLWNGRGSNGKGTLNELIMTAFGQYYKTLDSNVLTKASKSANEASPALANKKGSRIVVSTEPENDTGNKLQVNLLKKMTGGDKIETRALFKECIEFAPQFGLIIQCNDIPEFTTIDYAIERRLRIINFPFTFTANPVLDFHRKGDPAIKEVLCKSAEWRDNFMLILLDIYEKHIMNAKTIEQTEAVKNNSKEFLEDSNPTTIWIKENYDITNNKDDKIKSRDLYENFKTDTKSSISEVKFSTYMKASGFEKKKNVVFYYIGLKRKQSEEDDE
jgi:P4 family phage/plasmid primase-like protien